MTKTVFRKSPSISAQHASIQNSMCQYKTCLCRHKTRMCRLIRDNFSNFSKFLQYESMHGLLVSIQKLLESTHNSLMSIQEFRFCPMSRCMNLCIDASVSHASGFLSFRCLHRHIASCVDPYCYFSPKTSLCF